MASSVWWVVWGRLQVAGSDWRAAKIMTSVKIMVLLSSGARPLRCNFTMPHDHSVDNRTVRFYRNGSKIDLGESRFPTLIL